MKVFAWEPETYGSWCMIPAESVEVAKDHLRAYLQKLDTNHWSYEYAKKDIETWLASEPTSVYNPGDVILGEFA